MAGYGFSYVPIEGFVAFLSQLDKAEWANIDITRFFKSSTSPLEASRLEGIKLRITEPLRVLSAVVGGGDSTLSIADKEWDALQRELDGETHVHTVRRDVAKREAALRLRKNFTLGEGTAQTNLAIVREVDWGNKQAELAKEPQFAADLTLLGLTSLIDEIKQKTTSLETAEKNSGATQSTRLRAALSESRQAFNAVSDDLEYLINHPNTPESDKNTCTALLSTINALRERYPNTQEPTLNKPI